MASPRIRVTWTTFLAGILLLLLAVLDNRAQTTPAVVPVTGHVLNVDGTPYQGDVQLRFALLSCAGAAPRIYGSASIVLNQYILRPDATGTLSGTLWPNDVINCGGITGNTRWGVTRVVNNIQQGAQTCYNVLTAVALNLDTATPCPQVSPAQSPGVAHDYTVNNLQVYGQTDIYGTFFCHAANNCGIGGGSVGSQYTPQMAGSTLGSFMADPHLALGTTVYTSLGSSIFRHTALTGGAYSILRMRNTPDNLDNLMELDDYAPTWNYGSTPSGFSTTSHHVLNLIGSTHSGGINQGLGMSLNQANIGDHAAIYIYDNYMPGGALAGSDEGYAGIRMGSYPLRTHQTVLPAATNNTFGTSVLTWSGDPYCGITGGFISPSCVTAGMWAGDMDKPIQPVLHMTAYASATGTLPTSITTAELITPGVFVSSTATLTHCASLVNGCTVTIPVTLPTGFADPVSGHACISSSGEYTTEEVGYTLSGSNITLTAQRFDHWGGTITIGLQSCSLIYFAQDAADNNASATNGNGVTWYVSLGNMDNHHMLVTNHAVGSRTDGAINRLQSIMPDPAGAAVTSLFGNYPGALVIDVSDPNLYTYNGGQGGNPYLNHYYYAHVETNTVPFAAGDHVWQGYNAGDTYYFHREICDNNLADVGIGKDCWYMEMRGNPNSAFRVLSTYDPTIRARRHVPDFLFWDSYSRSNSTGAVSSLLRSWMAPDKGWLTSDHAGCGGHLDDPQNCPDHYFWLEGSPYKAIKVSDSAQTITFGLYGPYKWIFAGGINQPLRVDPANSTATNCTAGDTFESALYHYVCVATNTLKRVALSAF